MNLARQNAERLADDAKTMLTLGRTPTAAALAILAIEEAGKRNILRGLSTAKSDEEAQLAWRAFRSHRHKNGMWILPVLYAEGARRLCDLTPTVDAKAEHTAMLDAIKQVAIYSDCLAERHWSDPRECIDRELAEALVFAAELLSRGETIPSREIELWVEIVGPKVGTPENATAALEWHRAMCKEGLSDTPVERFAEFLEGLLGEKPTSIT
jgi:AbiV family abortive infection protein